MGLTVLLGMRLPLGVGIKGPLVGLEGEGLIFLIGNRIAFRWQGFGRGSAPWPEVNADLDVRTLPSDVRLKFMDLVHLLEFL